MDENKALVKATSVIRTFDDAERAARAMAASGYFQDAKQAAQAVVKVLAGHELGFGPFASMTGVHVIQGKPAIGANLMAAAVKRSGRYDYRVKRIDDEACVVAFYELGKELGESSFTIQEARKAGTKNLDKYPRNMLFARAISNGVRWFCPDVFAGAPVYTPEELGAEVDGDGNVVEGSYVVSAPDAPGKEPPPEDKRDYRRPYDPTTFRHGVRQKSKWVKCDAADYSDAVRNDAEAVPPIDQAVKRLAAMMGKALETLGHTGDQTGLMRHSALRFLFGVNSGKLLTHLETLALIGAWENAPGSWEPNDYAAPEIASILRAHVEAQGQTSLFEDEDEPGLAEAIAAEFHGDEEELAAEAIAEELPF